MIDILLDLLNEYCNGNIYEQGTLAADEPFPESFITYSVATSNCEYLDNKEVGTRWGGAIIYYSSDYSTIPSLPFKIRQKLKAAGFIIAGKGTPVPSSRPSHDGWALGFDYIEKESL